MTAIEKGGTMSLMPLLPRGREWTVDDLDRLPLAGARWELLDGMLMISPLPGREWTVDDVEQLPDYGVQYELLDGVLLVTPAPTPRHQLTALNLVLALEPVCPKGHQLFFAPLDWRIDDNTALQPDVLIVSDDAVGEQAITASPLLAVEVLSPSTRRKDEIVKRTRYAVSGVEHYWIVDPDEPSIVAYALRDGRYVEAGRAVGDQTLHISAPFDVDITPAALVTR